MANFYKIEVLDHSVIAVILALAISFLGSSLLVQMMHQARLGDSGRKTRWRVATAIVAGTTVWTTHFVAMIGYRPDKYLTYELAPTLISFIVGISCVGIPLAISTTVRSSLGKGLWGAAAGLGISGMHFVGMSALADCSTSQSGISIIAASFIGSASYAAGKSFPSAHHPLIKTVFFALGLCATHFTAIAGFEAIPLIDMWSQGWGGIDMSIPVTLAALAIFLGSFASIVASKRLDRAAADRADILSAALNNMTNGLLYVSNDGVVKLYNKRFLAIFKLDDTHNYTGMHILALFRLISVADDWNTKKAKAIADQLWDRVISLTSATSDFTTISGTTLHIRSAPADNGYVITIDDVTEQRTAQSALEHLAYHDPLTGLGNRRALQERMENGFNPKRRYKLLIIDLDRFKIINDTMGHKFGDILLKQVATRMLDTIEGIHFVARFGGDEFAILVYGDLDTAQAVADKVISSLACAPFILNGKEIYIGCSIGMCCTDDAETVEDLVQRSDAALYEAKKAGRSQSACYRDGLLEAVFARHSLENDIQEAIDHEHFKLAFQPVLSLKTDRVIGYEALLRWEHRTRGFVSPAEFIPIAEETGQIISIGEWVLKEACRHAITWPSNQYVAVNVSPVQFRSSQLYADIVAALRDSGLEPKRLELELTETAITQDNPAVAETLKNLKLLGVTVAMDDFGTGFSSLSHLCNFPLDRIKIDRSFVQKAERSYQAMAVLRAVVQIGKDMKVAILAEGIETEGQLELLRNLGCDDVQGFLVGMPKIASKPMLVDQSQRRRASY